MRNNRIKHTLSSSSLASDRQQWLIEKKLKFDIFKEIEEVLFAGTFVVLPIWTESWRFWCSSLVEETLVGGEVAWRGGGGGGGGITVESSKAEYELPGSSLTGCCGRKVVGDWDKMSVTYRGGELSILGRLFNNVESCGSGDFKALTAAAAWPRRYMSWMSGFWLSTVWRPSSWGRSKTLLSFQDILNDHNKFRSQQEVIVKKRKIMRNTLNTTLSTDILQNFLFLFFSNDSSSKSVLLIWKFVNRWGGGRRKMWQCQCQGQIFP